MSRQRATLQFIWSRFSCHLMNTSPTFTLQLLREISGCLATKCMIMYTSYHLFTLLVTNSVQRETGLERMVRVRQKSKVECCFMTHFFQEMLTSLHSG